MSEVCVDASFVLKVVLPEPGSERVRAKWASWIHDGVVVIAPWLWMFETHSVLRRKSARHEMTDPEARDAWRILHRQGIRTVHPRGLFDRAWVLATELGRSNTYDAIYVAAAELRKCELWTADYRLANAARRRLGWVQKV